MPQAPETAMMWRALRMFAETMPGHPSKTKTAKHVGRLLEASPEKLRNWACFEEMNAGLAPGNKSKPEIEI